MLREQYCELFERLSREGVYVQGMFESTPREILWRIQAMAERKRFLAEILRQEAWMIGKYAGIAVNAPEKYPPFPREHRRMGEEEMRRVLEGLARRFRGNER